jgi:hypothetical protein
MDKERKTELITTYGLKEGDTGSPEVQIAILTERITHLTEPQKVTDMNRVGGFPAHPVSYNIQNTDFHLPGDGTRWTVERRLRGRREFGLGPYRLPSEGRYPDRMPENGIHNNRRTTAIRRVFDL